MSSGSPPTISGHTWPRRRSRASWGSRRASAARRAQQAGAHVARQQHAGNSKLGLTPRVSSTPGTASWGSRRASAARRAQQAGGHVARQQHAGHSKLGLTSRVAARRAQQAGAHVARQQHAEHSKLGLTSRVSSTPGTARQHAPFPSPSLTRARYWPAGAGAARGVPGERLTRPPARTRFTGRGYITILRPAGRAQAARRARAAVPARLGSRGHGHGPDRGRRTAGGRGRAAAPVAAGAMGKQEIRAEETRRGGAEWRAGQGRLGSWGGRRSGCGQRSV